MALVTKEGLLKRLEDGRWHQVSPTVYRWLGSDPKYEIEYRRLMTQWRSTAEYGMPDLPNLRCRVRKKLEFLEEPFRTEMLQRRVAGR